MTVTFDITNDSRAVWRRSVLRLLVGDSAEGDGPRPKGGNYADDELDTFPHARGGRDQPGGGADV